MAWPTTSRQSRGYGAEWDRLRLVVLERDHYLCRCDQCRGGKIRLTVASEVNHIVSKADAQRKGWTTEQMDAPSNLQAVNSDCHKRITTLQQGRKPSQRIGTDGWPVGG